MVTVPQVPKHIVLLSDGTGNSSAKAEKTNVWRMFQALDQSGCSQIAKYDDGVGTSSNKYLAMLGGAFGWGLKRNVLDLYKFVCRNYREGDRICGFGFSRGAFTIRVVTGLISREGLVTGRTEQELQRHAAAAYRAYRSKSFRRWSPLIVLARAIRDAGIWLHDRIQNRPGYSAIAAEARHPRVYFLGLWDTVEAYGVPIKELKRGIDRFVWPMLFGDCKLPPIVDHAFHALSLDDERTTFHPLLWDEVDEANAILLKRARGVDVPRSASRITQVWFSGVHSNVGGGYPEDQLSLVSLQWMMDQALAHGLVLDPTAVALVRTSQSPYARLYDSRRGLASYYRYGPRQVNILTCSDGAKIWPIVHHSVPMRMAYGSAQYAPLSLPHEFWVHDPSGALVALSNGDKLVLDAAKTLGKIDTPTEPLLAAAITQLARADEPAVQLVWDTVFWRRCVYFLTIVLTGWLVAFPWVWHVESGNADLAVSGPVATIADALSSITPGYAQSWKLALVSYPLEFGGVAIAILLCLAGSASLEQRIHERSSLAWHESSADRYRSWRAHNRSGWTRWLLAILVLLAVCYAIAASTASVGTVRTVGVAAALVVLTLLLRATGYREVDKQGPRTQVRSTFALSIARWIRSSSAVVLAYRFLSAQAVPFVFATVVILGLFALLNRTLFDVEDSAGVFCGHAARPFTNTGAGDTVVQGFTNDQLCWPSGIAVAKGKRYLITVTSPADWLDQAHRTDPLGFDVSGFDTEALKYYAAAPLKRRWGDRWLQPIARIGALGNDEYPLEPIDDVSPWPPDRRVLRSVVEARSSGELFVYVNDAVWGIPSPRWAGMFTANNSGSATITVRRLPDPRYHEVSAQPN